MADKKLSDDELLKHAQQKFNESKNWRDANDLEGDWKKENDLYDSIFSTTERKMSDALKSQGRLFIPKTYSHTQRILVDVIATFFDDPEEIYDVVSKKNVPSEKRLITKAVLNHRLNGQPIDFFQEAYEACLDALKNKVCVMKVYPKLETETIKIIQPEERDENRNIITKEELISEEEIITSYEPAIECLPPEDVFFSLMATWKDYWKYTIIHRMPKLKDELRRMGVKESVLKELDPIKDYAGLSEIKQQRDKGQGSPFSEEDVKGAELVMVYDVWTFRDINNDGLLESVNYLAGGDKQGPQKIISGIQENVLPDGKPPFVVGSAFPEPHKMYGKSLPQIVEALQREVNAIRNQDREATALAIRKPVLVSKHAGINWSSLVNRKIGGVVMGDDIGENAIREMKTDNPSQYTFQQHQRVDQDFFETTSVPPALFGIPANKEETATGVSAHEANANKKISMIIKNLSNTLFVPVGKKILALEQEYESDEYVIQVTGETLGWGRPADGTPARNAIKGEFDLTVNRSLSKQSQIQRLMMLIERGNLTNQSTMGMVQAGVVRPEDVHFVNIMALYHRLLPLLGEKNIEEFMTKAQPPPPPPGEGAQGPPGIASQTRLPGLGLPAPSETPGGVLNNVGPY